MNAEIETSVRDAACAARDASRVLARATAATRNAALRAMARGLRAHVGDILAANGNDMDKGRDEGMSEGLLDRLMLDEARIESMACALESLAELPDPLNRTLERREIDGGMDLRRVTTPLGVVAMVYEARPNVTVDAAGICLKSGNACVLRGGSQAFHSNMALAKVLREAVQGAGLPADCVRAIETVDRAATDALMELHGIVDVLIPRGGAGLIRRCVECSKVPVIETGTGNCHVYVHETADFAMARAIVMNAKTQRTGVCNACESLLVDRSIAQAFLPEMLSSLAQAGVLIHGDAEARAAFAAASGEGGAQRFADATEQDWGREYLAPEISVKAVDGIEEAIRHINRYGTGHSECIVADESACAGASAIEDFLAGVDAAAVYANASTRFTDGGCFGLGAEIGISTQKLHVRGPFALDALTSYKYVIRGTGQVRG
ncbi:MAG: glutamate-5-semialdehyde dehydrogenase [Slackia piriformis]|uniref:Gamma-glutamyl phosphate reductase n=1 Tax=Slackia piriformis TaxID=626934 RepID=A0A943Z8A9_9ACTN|nr:glutamate-5-semialdehyde dehydrogenase [Slackia piriformis]